MTNTQFSSFAATPKIDQAQLISRYANFLRLQSVGIPMRDARMLSNLNNDTEFEKARAKYLSLT